MALELSAGVRSVAAWDSAGGPPVEVTEAHARHTRLFALIQAALEQAGWERAAVEGLAIGLGPGSYTGIRMAIAAAQGWQAVRPVRLWGISSFHVMAEGLWRSGQRGEVFLAVDAQRGEACWAGYRLAETGWQEIHPPQLLPQNAVRGQLAAGAKVWGPDITGWCPGAMEWHPRAKELARLAASAEAVTEAGVLTPIYLREARFAKAPPPRVLKDL
ncbi:MAG: tRNA (adenosine(37)-N6)-threonylcarbamoyltransferase complex dimerization subunit type 1 TsaB [Verrucomicrobiae bacterium]|nr:tRNA (adenosine(37)-N6)-threonylcarbamoyltransferase complex dimerization subunit type 1 TsaB [Verrucomicrobiae bacterium]